MFRGRAEPYCLEDATLLFRGRIEINTIFLLFSSKHLHIYKKSSNFAGDFEF